VPPPTRSTVLAANWAGIVPEGVLGAHSPGNETLRAQIEFPGFASLARTGSRRATPAQPASVEWVPGGVVLTAAAGEFKVLDGRLACCEL
jgi:hypothetical protein